MTYDPRNIVSSGFPIDDVRFTYNITGAVTQDDLGKALTLDTSAANSFKLAGDGDPIHGRLETYEDRTQQGAGKVGTVARQFKEKLPLKAALAGLDIVAIGDSVVGAGAGEIQAANDGTAKTENRTLVVEVGTDFAVVEYL